jgi:hypothetical protein
MRLQCKHVRVIPNQKWTQNQECIYLVIFKGVTFPSQPGLGALRSCPKRAYEILFRYDISQGGRIERRTMSHCIIAWYFFKLSRLLLAALSTVMALSAAKY